MTPQQILKADLLDIIFENRNKVYGAYDLRKNYTNRIAKALMITASICILAVFIQQYFTNAKGNLHSRALTKDFFISDFAEVPNKPKEIPKPKVQPPTDNKMAKVSSLIIVKDKDFQEKDMLPPVEEIDKSVIGFENKNGNEIEAGVIPEGSGESSGENMNTHHSIKEADFTSIQIEAEFLGGQAAWTKYLEKNLNSEIPANNGAPAGKYVVAVLFRVETDGSINNITIENDPGFGTADEAIRVIKKAPIWKPANQNGKLVPSTKKQIITFMVNDNGR